MVLAEAAVAKVKPGILVVEEIEQDGPLADEVLMKVQATGVYHTDTT